MLSNVKEKRPVQKERYKNQLFKFLALKYKISVPYSMNIKLEKKKSTVGDLSLKTDVRGSMGGSAV